MTPTTGLEGVVVADTTLSKVDGARGELVIAGRAVTELAATASYEDACTLLWGPADWQARLGAGRVAAFEALGRVGDALSAPDGMAALRAAVAHLATDDPAAVTAAVAVYAAVWQQLRAGNAPTPPRAAEPHAADYLRMATGTEPSAAQGACIATYLVGVADHGMNASTFAARTVASTGSDLVSAVVAAIGALKGPLHGGAPGPVLDMLDAIGEPARARRWLAAELEAGRRIMGMGHRVYRVRDPRAAVFERAIETIGSSPRLALARAVEREAAELLRALHPNRTLCANVEFYTALLLDALGIDRTAFSLTFAVGRALGWCAHVDEQRRTGRLIRPKARYVGPRPRRA